MQNILGEYFHGVFFTTYTEWAESDLHKQFDYCRMRGEWFQPDSKLVDFISNNSIATGNCIDLICMVCKKYFIGLPNKIHCKNCELDK